jgi:glycosyltransferase involved in cell wall biosynthesis
MNKRTVIFVSQKFGFSGGAMQSAFDMLWALSKQDIYKLYVISSSPQSVMKKKKIDYNQSVIEWIQVKRYVNGNNIFSMKNIIIRILNVMNSIFSSSKLLKLSSSKHSAVIVNSVIHNDFYNDLCGYGIIDEKSILFLRGSTKNTDFTDLKNINYVDSFDKIVFVSKSIIVDWKKKLSRRHKCYYVPNTITTVYDDNQNTYSSSEDLLKVVCIGSIIPRKNQKVIIDWYSNIIEVIPNIQFVLVGEYNNQYGRELYDTVKKSEMTISFVGPRMDIFKYLNDADIFLTTSLGEALPRSVLEAMVAGLPIIATRIDGHNELVVDHFNGYLFEPDKPEDMIKAMSIIEKDSLLRDKMGQNSKAYYDRQYSSANYLNRIKMLVEGNLKEWEEVD